MNRFHCVRLQNSPGFADWSCLVENVTHSIRLQQHDNVCQVQIEQHIHRPPTLNFISIGADQRLHLSLQENVVKILAKDSTIASVFRSHSNSDVEYTQDESHFDFGKLPTELQVHIFSYLSCFELINAARVCKRWKEISKCARDAKRYMRIVHTIVDDKVLNHWLGGNKNLKCFKHSHLCDLRMSALEILGSKCPHLEILELSTCNLTDRGLWVIANGCRNLKRCRFQCPRITEFGIRWLFVLCKEFEHLEIIGNYSIKGLYLHDSFPNLKTLVLKNCGEMHEFTDIFQSFPNLMSLTLKDLPQLVDDHLKMIYVNCTKIERLEICDLDGVSRFGLQSIAGFGNLKSLSIESINAFGIDYALNDITKICSKLSNLNISRCGNMTDRGAESLYLLHNLKTLSINHMNKITSKSLKEISSCQNLQSLSIEGCANVDNSGPLAVVSKCLNLEVLKVSDIRQINTDFIVNCCKCFDMERHAKTLNIEVRGCSVFTAELMTQYPLRADEFHFFAKCREDGRWDAAKWLWGFSEMAPNNGGVEECEYWCQQY